MDSWIFQGGYPMVSVEASPDGTTLTLTQQRFTYRGDDDGTRWQVPIMLRAALAEEGAEHHAKVLLTGDRTTVELPSKAEWILVPMRLFSRVIADEGRPRLERFARRLVSPALARIGWEPVDGEGERIPMLRANLIAALGTVGADPETRTVARDLHNAYLADRN